MEQSVPEQFEKTGISDAFHNIAYGTAAGAGRGVEQILAIIGLQIQPKSFVDASAAQAASADMLMELQHILYFLSLHIYKH